MSSDWFSSRSVGVDKDWYRSQLALFNCHLWGCGMGFVCVLLLFNVIFIGKWSLSCRSSITFQVIFGPIFGSQKVRSIEEKVPFPESKCVWSPLFSSNMLSWSMRRSIILPVRSVCVLPHSWLWPLKSPVIINGDGSWFITFFKSWYVMFWFGMYILHKVNLKGESSLTAITSRLLKIVISSEWSH